MPGHKLAIAEYQIDFLASMPHFIDHLAPVFLALPAQYRGSFFCAREPRRGSGIAVGALQYLHDKYNVKGQPLAAAAPYGDPVLGRRLLVVASGADHAHGLKLGRRMAYLNHGIGQFFREAPGGDNAPFVNNSSYVGTTARKNVSLFLVPGPKPAAILRKMYPDATIEVVGAPKLQPYLRCKWQGELEVGGFIGDRELFDSVIGEPPLVVLSFHWDGSHVVPEAGTALPEYIGAIPHLPRLLRRRLPDGRDKPVARVAMHAHPRIAGRTREMLERAVAKVRRESGAPEGEYDEIPFIHTFDEVLESASLYCTDASSTLYEYAATGRPVLVLNSRHVRKDVNHGLRFWEASEVGLNVWPKATAEETAGVLADAIVESLEDRPAVKKKRVDALKLVYGAAHDPPNNPLERAVSALIFHVRLAIGAGG